MKKCTKTPATISSIKMVDALKIIQAYGYRMQIEQNFRDTKNSNYGYGLEHSGTKDRMRLENLLTIALVATFMALLLDYPQKTSNYTGLFKRILCGINEYYL